MAKVLIATEKPFAQAAVAGIRTEIENSGNELLLLEKYTEKEQLLAAVGFVQLPGNDAGGIAPGGGDPGGVLHGDRHNTADNTVFLGLLDGHVTQPLFHELLNVEVDGGGAAEYLRISRPTHSLVSLRAVRGNVNEIAFLTPDYISVKLIDFFISA